MNIYFWLLKKFKSLFLSCLIRTKPHPHSLDSDRSLTNKTKNAKFLLIFYVYIFHEIILLIDLGMQAKFVESDQFDKLEFTLNTLLATVILLGALPTILY